MGKKIAIITIGLAAIAIIAAVLLRFVFFTLFYVAGDMMEPTFAENSAVVVSKIDRDFERGDIVVAKTRDGDFKIGRVVGMPGEEIEIEEGSVFIEREKLVEDYTKGQFPYEEAYGFALKEGEYLLLPDNRETADGRNIFATREEDVVGKYSPKLTGWFESIFGFSK